MNKTEKIILRDKLYKSSEIFINIEKLKEKKQYKSLQEYIQYYGIKKMIKDIYDEDIIEEKLESSLIYNSYFEALNSEKDNNLFKVAYKIRDDIAITITEHIHVCRIAEDFFYDNERIIPWYCIESYIYIADSWWEDDKDIIKDFSTLSYIDFLVKYKMY